MHRDIKPSNLGVAGLYPPRCVILDLDSATRDETLTNHLQGTLSYLAPEIVALKESDRERRLRKTNLSLPPPYGRKVDVWTLGVSAYTIYSGKAMFNYCMTAHLYKAICQDLERKIHEANTNKATIDVSFLKIVQRMLAWSVHQRPTAAEALEVFREIDGAKDEEVEVDSDGLRVKRQQLKKSVAIKSQEAN